MENLVIQKPALKFMVEVTPKEDELCFKVNRYIEANNQEEMPHCAVLAKYDAIKYKDKFYNCHEVIHQVLDIMKNEMEQGSDVASVKITLKRNRTFGNC